MSETPTARAVSLLGVGAMGQALARALLSHGHRVTVWNRTAAKCEAVRQAGARVAATPADAAEASEVVVVCLRDYPGTRALLKPRKVVAALHGKLLVQLTTGTPVEARDLDAWATRNSIAFLDGKIMASPATVGADGATILYSGSTQLFEANKTLLLSLGAKPTYVGAAVGAAATLDAAALSYLYASAIGFLHAAAMRLRGAATARLLVDARRDRVSGVSDQRRRDDVRDDRARRLHLSGVGHNRHAWRRGRAYRAAEPGKRHRRGLAPADLRILQAGDGGRPWRR